MSGGADFTVKLWDLYSGDLVANFAVHGGKVKNIISCPPDVNVRTYVSMAIDECCMYCMGLCLVVATLNGHTCVAMN